MKCLFMPPTISTVFLACFTSLFMVVTVYAGEDPVIKNADDISVVLSQAEQLQLAEHEIWYALLHYKREILSQQFISQADDENFFLSENGKTDAHAELVADIKAFFRGPESRHAQCLFPARWWWLKQQLNISDDNDVSCPLLEAFQLKVSHDRLSLVFPTMYLNNPGSIFGHTFLRFDGRDESVLLSQTLNYAARVKRSDDLVSYVAKGLFGGYSGIFKSKPYYRMVQEYSNIENRDIWEYQLDLSAEEMEQLVRHVWEVKGIDFDYYFFRENCAYRLLALLDVVRPGMQLTGEGDFLFYALPVDTVRKLDDKNLIRSRFFRAALSTKIDDYFIDEKKKNTAIVATLLSDKTAADKENIDKALQGLSSDTEKIDALEQSYNILQFHGQATSVKAQAILQQLSELSLQSGQDEVVSDVMAVNDSLDVRRVSPEKGHESTRIAAGYGEQNSRQYIDLRFRPAFHDLLDAPQGYIDGAAINIFDIRLKGFTEKSSGDRLRLESLRFLNITSLSPLSQWQTPVSWLFDIRLDRTQLRRSKSVRNFTGRGGVGVSIKQKAFMPFALLMGEWNLSSGYRKGYSMLLGLQTGLYFNYKTSQFELSYEKDVSMAGFDLDKDILRGQWQYNLQVNHAIRLQYKRIAYDFFDDDDWSVSYHYYF
ncbi:MAG TPA: DUF4105 domain-containing protein [Gammaproteobacteria bacterium]|nr:DUF4105 domain-containing protein [Gammaproteobacteria bacterium]